MGDPAADPDIPLTVRATVSATACIVALDGEIDISTAPLLARALEDGEQQAPTLVVDMSAVGFIDSSGLRELVEAHRRLDEAGRRLLIVAPSACVSRALEVSGLEQRLEIAERYDG